jgi:aspartyl/glutamyl-tRNA(Asn/Gln) amidotransferase C subunit
MKLQLEDIEKLSDLARIEVSDTEKAALLEELQAIVGYISEIEQVVSEDDVVPHTQFNVTRPDVTTNEPREFTENILENAPKRNGEYIQVDQVL